jgi:hypothetical protein
MIKDNRAVYEVFNAIIVKIIELSPKNINWAVKKVFYNTIVKTNIFIKTLYIYWYSKTSPKICHINANPIPIKLSKFF